MTLHHKRPPYYALLLGLLVAGVSLAGWGTSLEDSTISIILVSVGSALFGTSISGLVGSFSAGNHYKQTRAMLAQSLASRLTSKEQEIVPYRKRYYRYVTTQMNGDWVWRCSVLDFRSGAVGCLTATTSYTDKSGAKKEYQLEGIIRDSRLILFSKATQSVEPVAVQIYPQFAVSYHDVHCGVQIVVSWDSNDALVPVILSDKPVRQYKGTGTVPPEIAEQLDTIWRNGFRATHAVFPREIVPVATPREGTEEYPT